MEEEGSVLMEKGGVVTSPMSPADLRDSAELRRRFVERFEVWLEDLLARPEPAMGIAADLLAELEGASASASEETDFSIDTEGGDLYSLWSAVRGLTREVQRQGVLLRRLVGNTDDPPAANSEDPILRQLARRQQSLHHSALNALCGSEPLRAQSLLAEAQRLHETDAGRRLGLLIEWWLATEPPSH